MLKKIWIMKKMISIFLVAAAFLAFAACTPAEPQKTTPSLNADSTPTEAPTEPVETPEPPVTDPSDPIVLAENGQAKLYIVMPRERSLDTVYAKDKLFYFVKNAVGVELEFGQNSAGYEYELLLGNTGREESTSFTESLPDGKYGIKIDGKKLIIASKELTFLYDAVEYMIENFINVSETGVVVNMPTETYIGDGSTDSLRHVFSKIQNYKTAFEKDISFSLVTSPPSSQICTSQGGCTDGTFFYQAFISYSVDSVIIVKQDKNGKVIKRGKPLGGEYTLDHANDLTYNSETNEIFVVHAGGGNDDKITVLDADTLEFKRSIKAPSYVYAISYSPERDCMLVWDDSRNIRMLNSTATEDISVLFTTKYDNYTRQGICSDDTFIYCLLIEKSTKRNYIFVYNWYGNFVCTIDTGISYTTNYKDEGENLSIYEGQLHMSVSRGLEYGSRIYRLIPEA